MIDPHGHELAWIEQLTDLPDESRKLVERISRAGSSFRKSGVSVSVSSFATPSTWQVETDRGDTTLMLKGEEDIRRLSSPALLIADSHGVNFLVRDRFSLDSHSRKILDRFL